MEYLVALKRAHWFWFLVSWMFCSLVFCHCDVHIEFFWVSHKTNLFANLSDELANNLQSNISFLSLVIQSNSDDLEFHFSSTFRPLELSCFQLFFVKTQLFFR